MARRFRRGKTGRRRSYWQSLFIEVVGTNVAALVQKTDALVTFAEGSNKSATLVRIVGSCYLGLQGSPSSVTPIYWGIFVRPTAASGGIVLNPSDFTDFGSELWLHWRIVNEFQADLVHHRIDDSVDIKVMRKLDENMELMSAAKCIAAYHTCVNLRGLMLAT